MSLIEANAKAFPQLELAYSLMMALPGTPVFRYGDEIGMGDNLDLPERKRQVAQLRHFQRDSVSCLSSGRLESQL